MMKGQSLQKDGVKSLEKALNLLVVLSRSDAAMGLDDLTRQAGLKKTSCFRMLQTMKNSNFVEQDAGTKRYRLGVRAISVGAAALKSLNLRRIALPLMEKLHSQSGETINLGILDGTEVVFAERLESKHILSTHHNIGDRLPVHCTCMGKCLLAFLSDTKRSEILRRIRFDSRTGRTITSPEVFEKELEKVRKTGLAVNNEELEQGLCAVSGPVRNYTGEAVASINIAFPLMRHDQAKAMKVFAPLVKDACAEVSRILGFLDS
jgi:DNA-binding IclR family transcriptional regulator